MMRIVLIVAIILPLTLSAQKKSTVIPQFGVAFTPVGNPNKGYGGMANLSIKNERGGGFGFGIMPTKYEDLPLYIPIYLDGRIYFKQKTAKSPLVYINLSPGWGFFGDKTEASNNIPVGKGGFYFGAGAGIIARSTKGKISPFFAIRANMQRFNNDAKYSERHVYAVDGDVWSGTLIAGISFN